MKEIQLSTGGVALVDDEDFDFLSKWKWKQDRFGYVTRSVYRGVENGVKKYGTVKMHKLILPNIPYLDHKDGNGANNQKSNLRACTHAENMRNVKKRVDCTTGFTGVRKGPYSYHARVQLNGRQIHVGCYDNAEAAAKARDQAATLLHGEFARLNFPETLALGGQV
jgi:hypothetical protein